MRYLIALIALSFLITSAAYSQFQAPEGGGIVYGSELGVIVGAPKGWIFDAKSGVSQGLYAVMYPVGSSWAKATEVMYVNTAKSKDGESLDSFITGDLDSFKKNSPTLHLQNVDPITLSSGQIAQVRLLSGDQWGNYECIAYAQKGTSVAIYVLSCKSQQALLKSLPAFREMVSNSVLINVEFKK